MKQRLVLTVLGALLLAAAGAAEPPATAPASRPVAGALLSVGGKVPTPLSLDAAALAAMPRAEVRVKDRAGNDAVYAGVPLRDLLRRAGAPVGDNQMRGPNLALYLVVGARDGYRVVFSLAECDADLAEHDVLVADRHDGKPLTETEGPLRVIVPGEKKQARWVRQLVSLRVEAAAGEASPRGR